MRPGNGKGVTVGSPAHPLYHHQPRGTGMAELRATARLVLYAAKYSGCASTWRW